MDSFIDLLIGPEEGKEQRGLTGDRGNPVGE